MGVKLKSYGVSDRGECLAFRCPGCGYDHAFHVGGDAKRRPQWTWNGSLESPTFMPSIVVFKDDPIRRCHSFVKDGKIQFLDDSFHALKGKTVELPDWSCD